jgi:hypothetical protein
MRFVRWLLIWLHGFFGMPIGDVVAQGTKALGIAPCGGCSKRQAILNSWHTKAMGKPKTSTLITVLRRDGSIVRFRER